MKNQDYRLLVLDKHKEVLKTLQFKYNTDERDYGKLIREIKQKLNFRLYSDLHEIGRIRNKFAHNEAEDFKFGAVSSSEAFERFCNEVLAELVEAKPLSLLPVIQPEPKEIVHYKSIGLSAHNMTINPRFVDKNERMWVKIKCSIGFAGFKNKNIQYGFVFTDENNDYIKTLRMDYADDSHILVKSYQIQPTQDCYYLADKDHYIPHEAFNVGIGSQKLRVALCVWDSSIQSCYVVRTIWHCFEFDNRLNSSYRYLAY